MAQREMRGNPVTNGKDNFFQGGYCDCNGAIGTSCQDSAAIGEIDEVTGFTYLNVKGETITAMFPAPVSGPAAVAAATLEALANYEYNLVVYTEGATDFTIKHEGFGTIVNFLLAAGNIPATRTCTVTTVCDYCVTVSATPGDVSYDVLTTPLAGAPYASAATLQTDFAAALTTVGAPIVAGSVTAAVNAGAGGFDLKFKAEAGSVVTVGTKTFVEQNCESVYM